MKKSMHKMLGLIFSVILTLGTTLPIYAYEVSDEPIHQEYSHSEDISLLAHNWICTVANCMGSTDLKYKNSHHESTNQAGYCDLYKNFEVYCVRPSCKAYLGNTSEYIGRVRCSGGCTQPRIMNEIYLDNLIEK